jgi:hypothetical protein
MAQAIDISKIVIDKADTLAHRDINKFKKLVGKKDFLFQFLKDMEIVYNTGHNYKKNRVEFFHDVDEDRLLRTITKRYADKIITDIAEKK